MLNIEKFDLLRAKGECMDLKNLTTFLYAAELGSFTRTAEMLRYSQSTVSFQIKQLENELGTPLFERVGHAVFLTERGREVLRYAHAVTRLTQELQNSMASRPLLAGRVRMAMADSLCSVFAQEGYASFRAEYPDLSLKILTAGTGELLRMVNQNEADFIITLDSHIYNTEYVIRREKKVGVHFVAGPGCALAGQKEIPLKALIGQPFILAEQGMSYRRLMDEKLAGRSLEIQPVLEIGNTDHICALLEQGVGLSFLPDYVTDRAVTEGRLVRLAVEDFSVDIWQQLLYHRNKWVSPQMEAVMEHCAKTMF